MLVTTTHGDLDESLLRKREATLKTGRERTVVTEYYLGEELVHRSVSTGLIPQATLGAVTARIGA